MRDPAKPYVLRYLQTGSFAVMATPNPVRYFATPQDRDRLLAVMERMAGDLRHTWKEGVDYALETIAAERVA